MGGEQRVEACPLAGVELVGPAHQQEPRSEHFGVECRLGAFGAALDVAANRGQGGGEPSDDMEPIQDVAGVAEPRLYCCFVRRRAVGHDDLHRFAPPGPLGGQKTAQRLGIAVGHHGEHLAGVAVDDHRDVAVPFADRGLVHQQHPAPPPPAVLAD